MRSATTEFIESARFKIQEVGGKSYLDGSQLDENGEVVRSVCMELGSEHLEIAKEVCNGDRNKAYSLGLNFL